MAKPLPSQKAPSAKCDGPTGPDPLACYTLRKRGRTGTNESGGVALWLSSLFRNH